MFTRLEETRAHRRRRGGCGTGPAARGRRDGAGDALNGNPEVLYNPHPGGLTATVKNWTKFSTKCTYTADGWIVRNVNLSAFGSQDLEFPGVPLFHPWDVKVNCDNGKSTSFVYWY